MKKYIFSLMAIFATVFTLSSCLSETTSDVIISVLNGYRGDITNVGISSQAASEYNNAIHKSVGGEKSDYDIILRGQSSDSKAINGAKSGAESMKKQYLANGITYKNKTYQVEEAANYDDSEFSVSVSIYGFDEKKTVLTHYYKYK